MFALVGSSPGRRLEPAVAAGPVSAEGPPRAVSRSRHTNSMHGIQGYLEPDLEDTYLST